VATIKPAQLSAAIKKKIDIAGKQTSKSWSKAGSKLLKNMIDESLDKGDSPVAGQGKFKGYAKSTNKKNPVNLIESGKMRNSLQVFPTSLSNIAARFTSPINKYHMKGDDKLPKRQTLPDGDQSFTRKIKQALAALYKKLYKL